MHDLMLGDIQQQFADALVVANFGGAYALICDDSMAPQAMPADERARLLEALRDTEKPFRKTELMILEALTNGSLAEAHEVLRTSELSDGYRRLLYSRICGAMLGGTCAKSWEHWKKAWCVDRERTVESIAWAD